MCILCLNFNKDRRVQALLSFKEALRMGLKDTEILEEIGDLYFKEGELQLAIDAYKQVTINDPEYGEGWEKLADTYCSSNDKKQAERSSAIDAFKRAI